MKISRKASFSAVAALTGALAVAGCGGGTDRAADDQYGAGMTLEEPQGGQSPVTLTGCLQRGDGSEYILTENIDPNTVGTSGEHDQSGSADRVQPQQRKAASRSYRLSGENGDRVQELVGQQVRVSGSVEDHHDRNRSAVGTSGNETAGMATGDEELEADYGDASRNRQRHEIEAGDLARIEVQSIERTGQPCGTAGR